MKQLLDLMRDVLNNGEAMVYRKGQIRHTRFGGMAKFDLSGGTLPVMTTRKPLIRGAIGELLWFLSGSTNVDDLKRLAGFNLKIWDDWANDDGEIGPLYGRQWTDFGATKDRAGVNQIQRLVKSLKENPGSTGHVVSAWNPAVQPDPKLSYAENIAAGNGALSPCHTLFQVHVTPLLPKERGALLFRELVNELGWSGAESHAYTEEDYDKWGIPKYGLSLQLYQRSCDLPIGGPVNILTYSLLAHMLAHVTGMVAKEFIWTLGNYHIYDEHIEQAKLQVQRPPLLAPRVRLNSDVKNIEDFTMADILFGPFRHHDALEYKVVS